MIPVIRPTCEREPTLVWLASYPKSGSTWVRMFIFAYLTGSADINKIAHYSDMEPADYEKIAPVDELEVGECFQLRTATLYNMNRIPDNKIVKTHCCNGVVHGVELIPQAFTKAAIYVVRDPRDVAISYADHMGVSIDRAIERMGDFRTMAIRDPLRQYLSTWSQHVESWGRVLPYRVIGLKYEDLLENPIPTFTGLARAITEGEVDEGKVKNAVESVSFEKLKKQEEDGGFVEKSRHQKRFFRKGKSTWRDVLSKDQVSRIVGDHGETMKKLGYL